MPIGKLKWNTKHDSIYLIEGRQWQKMNKKQRAK